MHHCKNLWHFCETSNVKYRASLYTMKHRYTSTYTGSALCPREEDEQSTGLHKGAQRCPWWDWAHTGVLREAAAGAGPHLSSVWPRWCSRETGGVRTLCRSQEQRDQPCHVHARGKPLVAATQLKQSFQKVESQNSSRSSIPIKLLGFSFVRPDSQHKTAHSLSWVQGFIALFFYHLLLMKGPVDVLGQNTEKGYEGNTKLSQF